MGSTRFGKVQQQCLSNAGEHYHRGRGCDWGLHAVFCLGNAQKCNGKTKML